MVLGIANGTGRRRRAARYIHFHADITRDDGWTETVMADLQTFDVVVAGGPWRRHWQRRCVTRPISMSADACSHRQ